MRLSDSDRLEISDLYARYCHIIDRGDAAGFARVYVSDGALIRESPADDGQENLEFRGSAKLEAMMRDSYALNQGRRKHWISGLVVDSSGDDQALGRCYLMVFDVSGVAPVPLTSGRYEDILVKTPDGWRFRERRVVIDQRVTAPAPKPH